MEPEDGAGHEGECALRTEHQLGEVVAARGFDEAAAGGEHLAGPEHELEAEHVVAGDPVLDRPHAAGIGGDVAAQTGRLLAGEHRVDEPVGSQCLVQLAQRDPGFDHSHMVGEIDLEDAVHPLERDDDSFLGRDAGTRKPCCRAPGGEGDAPGARRLHDGRHFLARSRSHHRSRTHACGPERFVVPEVLGDGSTHLDGGLPYDAGELGDQPVGVGVGVAVRPARSGRDPRCRTHPSTLFPDVFGATTTLLRRAQSTTTERSTSPASIRWNASSTASRPTVSETNRSRSKRPWR